MTDYRVTANHPVDTDDGQLVAPGETFDAPGSERLRQLLDDGLVERTKSSRQTQTQTQTSQSEETP